MKTLMMIALLVSPLAAKADCQSEAEANLQQRLGQIEEGYHSHQMSAQDRQEFTAMAKANLATELALCGSQTEVRENE